MDRQAALVVELTEVGAEIREWTQICTENADIQLASGADPSVIGTLIEPTPQPYPKPVFVTVDDVAKRLQVKPQTVRRWRRAGKLPSAMTLGGVIRWPAEVIDGWMADQEPEISR